MNEIFFLNWFKNTKRSFNKIRLDRAKLFDTIKKNTNHAVLKNTVFHWLPLTNLNREKRR